MKKVVLYMASSIDGFIAREDGSVDWLETEVDIGSGEFTFENFMKRVDTIFMGRKSYEQNLTFGPWAFGGKRTYVFSRSGTEAKTENTEVITDLTVGFVNEVKGQPGKDIWLFGGGDLNHFFLKNDLIDEIMLFIQPDLLGRGISLFGAKPVNEKRFRRKEARELGGGFTLLWYEK